MRRAYRVKLILVNQTDLTIALAIEEGRWEGDAVILPSGRSVRGEGWQDSLASAWFARGEQLLDIAARIRSQGTACRLRAAEEKKAARA